MTEHKKDSSGADSMVLPALEAPPVSEISGSGSQSGVLLTEESVASLSSKVMSLEFFLQLCTRETKFDDFMREILMMAMKVIRSEAGSVLEIDWENRVLFFRSKVGVSSDRLDKFTVPLGKGIVGHVAESKQSVAVNNVEENKVFLKAIQSAVGFETRNLVAVPIIIRGQVFAVLELLNRVGEANYSEADLELLKYICDQAAHAIEIRLMLGWALQTRVGGDQAA